MGKTSRGGDCVQHITWSAVRIIEDTIEASYQRGRKAGLEEAAKVAVDWHGSDGVDVAAAIRKRVIE